MYSITPKSLGKGAFSSVYQATSPDGRNNYALKRLKPDADASDAERFRREVEILSKLDHDLIIEVLFTDLLVSQPYFVMPQARQNLGTAINYDLSRQIDIQRIFREICEAVIYAHERGVLHRDLKPQNILLTDNHSVKVSDFGLARNFRSHQQGLTKINETGGTLPYAAPEQFDISLKDVDERADIYSLGKILYFLYTKRDPYHIDASDSFLPTTIYSIVRKATDGDRARRFDSVEALLKEFTQVVSSSSPPRISSGKPHPRKYITAQLAVQGLARTYKNKNKFINNQEIEHLATELQRLMWLNRDLLWKGHPPENPLEILDVGVAFDLLGFQLMRPATLGTFFDSGKEYEVAGQINQSQRVVSISRQFDRQITRFTEAHELGHSLLHTQEILHRDRPINGSHSVLNVRSEEFQANKFASYFLMPKKQVQQKFLAIFGVPKLEINQNTAEALIQGSVHTLLSETRNRRGLARLIAAATQIGNRPVYSLAELFGVSTEAMAIRLEEVGLVEFPSAYGHC